MAYKRTLGVLFVALALCGSGCAGPLVEAKGAYERGDYATALRLFRPLADQGNAEAQHSLGIMYFNGGDGLPRDHAEALRWERKAADQGNADAQNALGWAYREGRDVTNDDAEAAKWYRLAAEQGSAVGQYSLAFLYATGRGVPENNVQAYKWYALAILSSMDLASSSEQGDAEALGFLIGYRDAVAANMTAAQITDAQAMARQCQATNFRQCD